MRYAFLYIIVATICLILIDLGAGAFGKAFYYKSVIFFLPLIIYSIFFHHDLKSKFPGWRVFFVQAILYVAFILTVIAVGIVDEKYGSDFEDFWAETTSEDTSSEEDLNPLPTSDIENAKKQCEDIGFTPKTEKFGDCVLELNK